MEKEKISKFELFKKNMKTFINDYVITLTLSETPAVFILLILGLIMGFPSIILLFGLSLVLTADIIALAIGTIINVIKSNNMSQIEEAQIQNSLQQENKKVNIKQNILEKFKTIKCLLNQLPEEEKNKYISEIQATKNQLLENLGPKSFTDIDLTQISYDSQIMEFNNYLEKIQEELSKKIQTANNLPNKTELQKDRPLIRSRKKDL